MPKQDISLINPQTLRCFTLSAELGSLTAAATTLGVAQSALSRHIANLERCLGGRLFHRTGRGVEPTALGIALLPRARLLLQETHHFLDEALATRSTPAGVVNLGILPSMWNPYVSLLVNRLRADYPKIRLRVSEAYSGEVQALLAEGKVDVGVLNQYRPSARESRDALLTHAMCLVGRAGAPALAGGSIAFARLSELALALPAKPNSMRSLIDELANRKRLTLNIAFEASTGAILKDVVLRCDLYGIMPPHAVSGDVDRSRLGVAVITSPSIRQATFIETTRKHPLTDAARIVYRLLRAQIARRETFPDGP